MKSWIMPIVCAAALSLPMFSSSAQAGVADKAYDVIVVTTAFQFIEDVLEFDDEDGVTIEGFTGTYNEIIDLGNISFFTLTLVDDEDETFEITLTGLQFEDILLARGSDSDGVQYFVFGTEVVPVE